MSWVQRLGVLGLHVLGDVRKGAIAASAHAAMDAVFNARGEALLNGYLSLQYLGFVTGFVDSSLSIQDALFGLLAELALLLLVAFGYEMLLVPVRAIEISMIVPAVFHP